MTPPPCAGKWRLFDSVRAADHQRAAALCATCPITRQCREQLDLARRHAYGYVPRGTWAGQLFGYHTSTHQETA